jgi:16S rRNA (adenine1518-N6/adenine1519-N6)-dimethyltransferase
MVQEEVWKKIDTEQHKKSFLWRLLNYTYNVYYRKSVWAKCFKPVPKVTSCLVEFQKKDKITKLDFDKLFEFLDLNSQFSRKMLWAIQKILIKQKKKIFDIPQELKTKRLEELSWDDIKQIISQK